MRQRNERSNRIQTQRQLATESQAAVESANVIARKLTHWHDQREPLTICDSCRFNIDCHGTSWPAALVTPARETTGSGHGQAGAGGASTQVHTGHMSTQLGVHDLAKLPGSAGLADVLFIDFRVRGWTADAVVATHFSNDATHRQPTQ